MSAGVHLHKQYSSHWAIPHSSKCTHRTDSPVWNTAETSWSVRDENHVWFHISGHFHSLEASSLSCGASPASSSCGPFNQRLIKSRERCGPVGRACINQILILPAQWLAACEEAEQMKGALWPQLPPSHERPFYCSGLLDNTRIMSHKGTIIAQAEHRSLVLSERGSYLGCVLCLCP